MLEKIDTQAVVGKRVIPPEIKAMIDAHRDHLRKREINKDFWGEDCAPCEMHRDKNELGAYNRVHYTREVDNSRQWMNENGKIRDYGVPNDR